MTPRALKKLLADLPPFRWAVELAASCASLGDVVDRLGRVQAALVAPESHEKALKALLIESGERAVEGKLFRAVVTPAGESVRLDTEKIREDMGDKWCRKYEKTAPRGASVRIYGRTGVILEAQAAE